MKNIAFFLMFLFILNACSLLNTSSSSSSDANISGKVFSGQASYYAGTYQGRKTASGEVYDKNKLTAAHKTLPFQTKVEVKNLKNGKSVIVKINDRLPNTSKREIDLSEAAAKQIDMLRDGVVNVQILVK